MKKIHEKLSKNWTLIEEKFIWQFIRPNPKIHIKNQKFEDGSIKISMRSDKYKNINLPVEEISKTPMKSP